MIGKIEAPTLTKTTRLDAKAQVTNTAARAIIEAEAAKRDAKTLRLRAARLKAEEAAPAAQPATKVKKARKR